MGCSSSTALPLVGSAGACKAAAGGGKRKSKKGAKDEDPQDMSDSDVHKMREDILQRHDSEVDIIAQISAEREALKTISSVKIERKYSCEDLLDAMTRVQVDQLSEDLGHYRVQKELTVQLQRRALQGSAKQWLLFNNLEAISSADITFVATFLLRLVRGLQKRNTPSVGEHDRPPPIIPIPSASASASLHNTGTSIDLTRFRHLERAIKALNVVTMSPASSFAVSATNALDWDLPPGLVTMHEARMVIDVYRRGGKLVPKAVHKLLRLAYRLLKSMPNTTAVTVGVGDKLTVVGDIHGQLADLFHILDAAGLPSGCNKYIFNGDFVDRGANGVEVMCVLLALFVARPDAVSLNRGNHEDFAICSVYGFQLECYEKYDPLTFGLFVEVFQQIPLFAVVNGAVFVVHGGLFHSESTTLEELNHIERTAFTLEEVPEEGEQLEGVGKADYPAYLQQLIRDALWSDPINLTGKHPSARGAGVSFGPDIVEAFLKSNGLQFVIRSHECVRSGYDEPYTSWASSSEYPYGPMLCTIFSASDYGGSGNSAAYLEFSVTPEEEEVIASPSTRLRKLSLSRQASADAGNDNMSEVKRINGTSLQYTVHYFYATPLRFSAANERDTMYGAPSMSSRSRSMSKGCYEEEILIGGSTSIEELICVRKQLLLEAFEAGDRQLEGQISQQHWLRAMSDVLNISLSWRRMARYLIKEEMTSKAGSGSTACSEIKYVDFLNSFDDDIIFGRFGHDDDNSVYNQALSGVHSVSDQEVAEVEDIVIKTPYAACATAAESTMSLLAPCCELSPAPYHGHLISVDVIGAIYSNHEKIEEAFAFLDRNGDGQFDFDDLVAGCETLALVPTPSAPSSSSSSGTSSSSSSSPATYTKEDIARVMRILDVFDCGAVDINVFFELFRLSLLSTSMLDDGHWTQPLLTRECSHAHELYRLSHYLSPGTPTFAQSGQGPVVAHGIHASQMSAMGSLELKKGVEISVDTELISADRHEAADVGLSIDI